MLEIPFVESDLLDFIAIKLFFDMIGNKFVTDRLARTELQKTLLVPNIIRHAIEPGALVKAIARQPKGRAHMPNTVELADQNERGQIIGRRQIEPAEHRRLAELGDRAAASLPQRF